MSGIDLAVVGLYLAFALAVGSRFVRRASRGIESFFVGSRQLPWWLAGTSMVATTFAADTPLAVTGIVAADGISGNWIWWCWATAHLTATFFFARLWRRSGVITDAEIVELRYGGRPAAALRGLKAIYFGVFVNCLTMAWVIAAMVKIARSFFEVSPVVVIVVCIGVSVIYTTLGGFRSVVVTDLVQFTLGMAGAVALAVLVVGRLGGIGHPPGAESAGAGMLGAVVESATAIGERTAHDVLGFVPRREHPTIPVVYFAVLLVAGWWRYAEGNGYIVQRLAACRSAAEAQAASLWFAVAHNALRPWPWILVGLASLVVYPQLPGEPEQQLEAAWADSETRTVTVSPTVVDVAVGSVLVFEGAPEGCTARLGATEVALLGDETRASARMPAQSATGREELTLLCPSRPALSFGQLRVELLDREMAYPLLMRDTLPVGVLGLVVASLLAAFMSTIDTHTNWGASYLVQDVYKRFIVRDAPQRHYVTVSRLAIVLMAVLAGVTALFIHNIAAVWRFLIALGAGLGSVAAARWYWPRVTPHAEFAALGVTTVLAVGLEFFGTPLLFGGPNPVFLVAVAPWLKIVLIAAASLAAWVPVALFGPRNDAAVLERFARRVRPPGRTWRIYRGDGGGEESLWPSLVRFGAGLWIVYGTLFGIGDLLLGRPLKGALLVLVAMALLAWMARRRGSSSV